MPDCHLQKIEAMNGEGHIIKQKLIDLNEKIMAGDENADMLKVLNEATEICHEKITAKMDKIKEKTAEKGFPCNIAPFFYTSCVMAKIAHVSSLHLKL